MADAGAVAAPAAPAAPTTAAPAQPGETKAEAVARYKADVGDGEQEYERGHLEQLALKGKEAARLLGKAEHRSQEVAKREKAMEDRLSVFKGKDLKAIRKALRDMGVDDLALANDVGTEKLRELDMSKEERRIHELEQERDGRLKQDEDAKATKAEEARAAETARHKDELGGLFAEAMEAAGLPKSSVSTVFPRLSRAYMAADAAGLKISPAVAADYLRAGIEDEHKALYAKMDDKTGQPVLDVDALGSALTRMFGPQAWADINRAAVLKYRASRGGGALPPAPAQQAEGEKAPTVDPTKINFWRELNKKGP